MLERKGVRPRQEVSIQAFCLVTLVTVKVTVGQEGERAWEQAGGRGPGIGYVWRGQGAEDSGCAG